MVIDGFNNGIEIHNWFEYIDDARGLNMVAVYLVESQSEKYAINMIPLLGSVGQICAPQIRYPR